MSADESLTRDQVEEMQKHSGEGYWGIVWTQLKKNRSGMSGLAIIALIIGTALLAPLLANDRPIVARYKGALVFPAFTTYVDNWIPWQSMRNSLKDFEVGGGHPFSDHYVALENRSWREVREAEPEQFDFALWPLVEWSPTDFNKDDYKKYPGENGHVLGTDNQGRDVLARLIHGAVVATTVGIIAMGIASFIGILLGVTAGYFGGWVDIVLARITEIVMCFPTFFLIIAVISFLEPSIMNIMLVLGLVGWTGIFRLIRGEVLRCKMLDYVTAGRALGLPRRRIMFRHLLPNAVSPVFVSVAFGIAGAVLTETSLSFLGFGDPDVASWGETLSQGRQYVPEGRTYLVIWPGLAIFVTLTAFNLFGQGLRDAMDPRLRR
jgi:peptide/nickel transport system permease protein